MVSSGSDPAGIAIQELSNLGILVESEDRREEPETEMFVTKELWLGEIMFSEAPDTTLIDWTGVSDIFL